MWIFAVPNSSDGLFKENKKALSDSQYLSERVHGLLENPPKMKPPVPQIAVMFASLLSHLAWKSNPLHPSRDPWYRSSKYQDTPSSSNQLSIWEPWCLDRIIDSIFLDCKIKKCRFSRKSVIHNCLEALLIKLLDMYRHRLCTFILTHCSKLEYI